MELSIIINWWFRLFNMNNFNKEKSILKNNDNLLSISCGAVIRNIRKMNGLSGAQLAKQLGISQQQMSRYERGINKFTLDMLFNMTVILNVPIDQVFNEILLRFQNSGSNDDLVLKNKIKAIKMVHFY